ncbi:MAG: 4-hydroxy-tetrahydrodipicolinate synthase [Flavobacteriaceae bacterium]
MKKFRGLGVALVTPFDQNGAIDIQALDRLVCFQIEQKVDYLVVLGTTAETATLTTDEKVALLERIKKINNNKLPIVLGIGSNDTHGLLRQLDNYDLDGVDAILSVCPYYTKPSQEGIFLHFSALARKTDLPVILYNVPGRTGVSIEVNTVKRLRKAHSNIIGIKEASGDLSTISALKEELPQDFQVISGDDFTTIPAIGLGAEGVISVIGQSIPNIFGRGVRAALSGNLKDANLVHESIQHFCELNFQEGNPTGIKSSLSNMNLINPYLRLPLVSATSELRSLISAEMIRLEAL